MEARSTGGSIQAGRACLRLGLPPFAAVWAGLPEAASGHRGLLAQGARRLMKSRAANRPNVGPAVDAVPR